MELTDLKLAWQNAGDASKTEADLQRMTRINNHPSLKKIRAKLLIEAVGLAIFLFVYYDGFDGDKKPFYANVLLVSSLLLYILNDVIGYIFMISPVGETNLKMSVQNFFVRIKRLSVLSLVVSFLYGISLILFFSSIINFTTTKYFLLTGMIIFLLVMTYFSFRMWTSRIKSLRQQVEDFES